MALTRTCLQLETEARQRADKVGSAFRDTAAFKRYLSASCRQLVSRLERISDYWASSTTVNTTASVASTALPTDAWKVLALRVTIDGRRLRMDEASIDDIDIEVTPTGWANGIEPAYRIRGGSFLWVPIPTAVHVVTVDYVPTTIFRTAASAAISELTSDTDTFDGIFGWEQWVVLDTAAKVRSDEGKLEAAQALRAEQQEVELELIQAAMSRNAESPERVRDTWRGGQDVEDYT